MILNAPAVENRDVSRVLFSQDRCVLNFELKELAYEALPYGEGDFIKDRNQEKSKSPDT
jgi:hypothetical protein